MTIYETEQSIINDLNDLGDVLARSEFLIRCGKAYEGLRQEQRFDSYLIEDCQVKTWVRLSWIDLRLSFCAYSESMLVNGALALFDELFNNRSREELSAFKCSLTDEPSFADLFTRTQLKGMRSIVHMILIK